MSPNVTVDDRGQTVTVIAFSGMAGVNRIYEWTRSFDGIEANFIGVRDEAKCWYQRGTSEIVRAVRTAVVGVGGSYVITLGASAGGFAALMFAKVLRANRILAFCPQSACGEAKRELGDDRWPDLCLKSPALDLMGAFPTAIVHVAADDPLDMMHAHRLCPGRLIVHSSGGHNFPIALKESGELRWIIGEAISA